MGSRFDTTGVMVRRIRGSFSVTEPAAFCDTAVPTVSGSGGGEGTIARAGAPTARTVPDRYRYRFGWGRTAFNLHRRLCDDGKLGPHCNYVLLFSEDADDPVPTQRITRTSSIMSS
jgi:hypothetical protein